MTALWLCFWCFIRSFIDNFDFRAHLGVSVLRQRRRESTADRLRAISILIQRAPPPPPLPPLNVPSPTLSSLTLESRLDPFGERISLAVSTQSFFEEEEVKLERGAEAGCCERPSVFPRGRHELRGSGIIAPQGVVDIIQGLSTAFTQRCSPRFRPSGV